MKPSFVHLHVHSDYSLLDGACQLDPLVQRVAELGMSAVALTDHGNLFGAVEFYGAAQARKVKPILGCEVYVAPGPRAEKVKGETGDTSFHLVLLARDETGYKNLMKLSSAGFLEVVNDFAHLDPLGDPLLAGDAVFRPRDGFEALGGNRLLALGADAVGSNVDAVQRGYDLAEQLGVDGIAVEEDPLFVALLAQVALVGRHIQARHHLGGLLGGHAATDLFGFPFQDLLVCSRFRLGGEFGHDISSSTRS